MPPLSLSSTNINNDSLLSDAVLTKADIFLKYLINPHNSTNKNHHHHHHHINRQEHLNAVMIYLEFNLARGHLKNISYSLNWILENHQLTYDFRHLIQKIDTVSEDCVRKTGKFKLFK